MPSVLYGVDDDKNVLKVLCSIETLQVTNELRLNGKAFENTLYNLTIEGEGLESMSFEVIPRGTQFCARKLLMPLASSTNSCFILVSFL